LVVDVLELLLVPLQLPTISFVPGWAVRLIVAPGVYWPEEQPGELFGDAVGGLPVPV
jgi:hypothetical protein